jgi:hypothetical protein
MKSTLKNALVATSIVFASGSAQALIIDHNDYLTDTYSGLDWLDLTATYNQTRQTVATRLQAGQDLEGWRYANVYEISSLVARFDNNPGGSIGTPVSGSVHTDNNSLANNDPYTDTWSTLFDLLGPTYEYELPNGLSHQYMFGLYNKYHIPEQVLEDPNPILSMGMAGFHNCAIANQVACGQHQLTDYHAYATENVPSFYQDSYDLNLSVYSDYVFNVQAALQNSINLSNVNRADGLGQDLHFGSFLVRNNPLPCDDGDANTQDIRDDVRCVYQNIGNQNGGAVNVSEPSSFALLGLSMLGLGLVRRKTKVQ